MCKIYQKSFSGEQNAGKYVFVGIKQSFEESAGRVLSAAAGIISVTDSNVIPGGTTKVIPEAALCVIPEGRSRESRLCETAKRPRLPTKAVGNDGVCVKRPRLPNPAGRQTLGNDGVCAKRPGLTTETFGNDGVCIKRRGVPIKAFVPGGAYLKRKIPAGFTLMEAIGAYVSWTALIS